MVRFDVSSLGQVKVGASMLAPLVGGLGVTSTAETTAGLPAGEDDRASDGRVSATVLSKRMTTHRM